MELSYQKVREFIIRATPPAASWPKAVIMRPLKLIKQRLILALIVTAVGSISIAQAPASGLFAIESPNTIVDQSGRRIVIEEPFKRVISLYGAHTENLFSLGLYHEIIGVSQHDDYPPRALGKPGAIIYDVKQVLPADQVDGRL